MREAKRSLRLTARGRYIRKVGGLDRQQLPRRVHGLSGEGLKHYMLDGWVMVACNCNLSSDHYAYQTDHSISPIVEQLRGLFNA